MSKDKVVRNAVVRIGLLFGCLLAALSLIGYLNCVSHRPLPSEAPATSEAREPGTTRVVTDTPAPEPGPMGVAQLGDPNAPAPIVGHCKADMVEVSGNYCPNLKEVCAEWMAPDDHFRCKRFVKPSVCTGATVAKHYCMDRYEYPNKKGQTPKVLKLWGEAQALCKEQGKRLCQTEEWTFACQGKEWKPYPYGWERDSKACRIDLGLETPSWAAGKAAGYEVTPAPLKGQASVNFSKPSGDYPNCKSDFGVYDMTGNVDEWVDQNGQSWLKGGWWGNVRNRCGPEAVTTGHDKTYGGIQVGFRCCSDPSK